MTQVLLELVRAIVPLATVLVSVRGLAHSTPVVVAPVVKVDPTSPADPVKVDGA